MAEPDTYLPSAPIPDPPRPARRRRPAVIVLAIVNTLLLLGLGALVAVFLVSRNAQEAIANDLERETGSVRDDVTAADKKIQDLMREKQRLDDEAAKAAERTPEDQECLDAVRVFIEDLEADDKARVAFDRPCGVRLGFVALVVD